MSTPAVFAGTFGTGLVSKNTSYEIQAASGAKWTKNDRGMVIVGAGSPLVVSFIDAVCDTKRSFVTMIDGAGMLLSFSTVSKQLSVVRRPTQQTFGEVTLLNGPAACVRNETWGTVSDNSRVWVANGCAGRFSRADNEVVECETLTPNGYAECGFAGDSSYASLVLGSCFELVPALDPAAGTVSFKVGWMGENPTFLVHDDATDSVRALALQSTSPAFKRAASFRVVAASSAASPPPPTTTTTTTTSSTTTTTRSTAPSREESASSRVLVIPESLSVPLIPPSSPQTSPRSSLLLAIVVTLLVIAGAWAAYYYFATKKKTKKVDDEDNDEDNNKKQKNGGISPAKKAEDDD
jgi:hypothetical protein